MADPAIAPGSIWRATVAFAVVDEIRIVSVTENRRVLLVEWLTNGRQLQMTADVIRSHYRPSSPDASATPRDAC